MITQHLTLIVILAAIQIFVAGYYFGQYMEWARTLAERSKGVALTLLILTMGFPLGILILFLGLLVFIYQQIFERLHILFIIKYFIIKNQKPHEPDKVKVIVSAARLKKETIKWYQFGDRIYIWIAGKLKEQHKELFK